MNKTDKIVDAGFVLAAVVILMLVFFLGRSSVHCSKPTILTDTIVVKDTLIIDHPETTFIERKTIHFDTIVIAGGESIITSDTILQNCYRMHDTIEGAYLQAEICSQKLDFKADTTLSGKMLYLPPPYITKVQFDTVRVIRQPAWYSNKKNYIIAGLSLTVGAFVYKALSK